MIYLSKGVTSSIWVNLKESIPVGNTASVLLSIQNDISGEVKNLYPNDLQPDNPWSRYDIYVGEPESLPDVIDLEYGMYDITFKVDSTILKTGKIIVRDEKSWTKIDRPAKNIKVLRRE